VINMSQTNSKTASSSSDTKVLLELENNSVINRALSSLLKSSFFVQKPVNWKPVKFELVVNTRLTDEFIQIKSEFQQNASESCEYEEKYGFLVEIDSQANFIFQNGFSCNDSAFNVIGLSKSGVYVCKYPDVSLKYSECKKWPDSLTLKMIVFKLCFGKQTQALVRKTAKLQPIPPTPGFNSHCSVIAPKDTDDIEVQYDQSQIYLYDTLPDKSFNKRPRHCLPYAIITWLKFNDGTEWPHCFTGTEADLSILETNTMELALSIDDEYIKSKLKETMKADHKANEIVKSVADIDNCIIDGINGTIQNTNFENGVPLNMKQESDVNDIVVSTELSKAENGENIENDEVNLLKPKSEVAITELSEVAINAETDTQKSEQPKTTSATPTTAPTATSVSANGTFTSTTSQVRSHVSHVQKSSIHPISYRQNLTAMPTSYLVGQPSHLNQLRFPYLGQAAHHANAAQQFFAPAQTLGNLGAAGMQQPIFFYRSPNGLPIIAGQTPTLFNAAGQPSAAYYQPNLGLGASVHSSHKYLNAMPQQPQQIIYQAAPQPAQHLTSAKQSNLITPHATTNGATVHQSAQVLQTAANANQTNQLPTTQSPKQANSVAPTQAQNQYQTSQNVSASTAMAYSAAYQQQLAASAYQGQHSYYALAQGGNGAAAQNYYTGAANYVMGQTGAPNLYMQPGTAMVNGFGQGAGAHLSLAVPPGTSPSSGYHIIDYRQMAGLHQNSAVSVDQFGIARPKILNLRHHPYQRS